MRTLFSALFLVAGLASMLRAQAAPPVIAPATTSLNQTTWRSNNARTGVQFQETKLTPANVNSTHFGLAFPLSVSGNVYAQPLFMGSLTIGGKARPVLFVATEADLVYAFDADTGALLWRKSLLPAGATTAPSTLVKSSVMPQVGVTGTPVIDPVGKTLYVVAESLESGNIVMRLHALSLITGAEKLGGPVAITASGFNPKMHLQRPALLLANGNVYIAFGSQEDTPPYHGWVFAYHASTLGKIAVWNDTPSGAAGGIWMSGAGISADPNGDIYISSGNGDFDASRNFGQSVVKLSPSLVVLDFFTPFNHVTQSRGDLDIGSSGVVVVPNLNGTFPHILITCAKFPSVFILNRDSLGKVGTTTDHVIQRVDNAVGGTGDKCFSDAAVWNNRVYFVGSNDVIKSFTLNPSTGKISTTSTAKGAYVFKFPGAHPVISGNGNTNGIAWAMDWSTGTLHAYNALTLKSLYTSPVLGGGVKWATPVVINGMVYVGGNGKVWAFRNK